jgi:hypothetical protein
MQARLKTTIGWFAERNSHDTVHWPMAPWEPRDRGNDVGEDLSQVLNSALVLAIGCMRQSSRSPSSASTIGMQDALTDVYASLVDDGSFWETLFWRCGRYSKSPSSFSPLVPDANSFQI